MLGEQDGLSIFFGIHASIVVRELTVFWMPKGTCASTSLAGMTVAQGADSQSQSISRWKVESAPGPTAPEYHSNS